MSRTTVLLFVLMLFVGGMPARAQLDASDGHGSGGIVTEAEMEAARRAYAAKQRTAARPKTEPYAFDVSDFAAVDPAVFERPGVHVLLAFPESGARTVWDDAAIQETARVLLEQRDEVWLANERTADDIVPLTILYTFHDYAGTGQLNTDNVDLYRGLSGPEGDAPHPLHAFRRLVGADFLYVVVPKSEPRDENGWRYYGWQNWFLPRQPGAELVPRTGGVLWSNAVEAASLDTWSRLILAHEMQGHGMGGCGHINGIPSVDLMRSSTPWGTNLGDCADGSFSNAAWVAEHWPAAEPVAVPVEDDALPTSVRLAQNYPNPFNPTTQISFDLPHPGRVELIVFDALGRKLRTLADGVRSAGTHTATFDARDLPSGIYLYRLTYDGTTQTRSMLLLR